MQYTSDPMSITHGLLPIKETDLSVEGMGLGQGEQET